jgi:hypothetical protein
VASEAVTVAATLVPSTRNHMDATLNIIYIMRSVRRWIAKSRSSLRQTMLSALRAINGCALNRDLPRTA